MAILSYSLCVLTSLACALLLFRAHRRVQTALLFWAACCFSGLSLSNGLIVVDLVVVPDLDLYAVRLIVAFASMLVLLFGMIWEGE